MMGYAWINSDISSWNVFDTIIYKILSKSGHEAFLHADPTKEEIETMNVSSYITVNYPATFIMHGNIDHLVPHKKNADILVSKFQELNVPYEYYLVKNINHGVAIAEGTNGEDWITKAIQFWQEQIADLEV